MMMAAIKHKKPSQHNRIGDSKAPTISLLSNSAEDFYQATLTPSFSHLSFSKLLDGEISDEELNGKSYICYNLVSINWICRYCSIVN